MTRRSPERWALLSVAAAFAASRIAYYLAGVRFDTTTLSRTPQLVEPDLLQHHLVSSIWYLHTQPPLYNLYLGLTLKLFGSHAQTAMHATYVVIGLALWMGTYVLTRKLGAPRWPAAAVTALLAASPTAIIFENWLYPDHLVMAGLVLAGLLLYRFAATGRTRNATAAFGLLAAVALSRSLFHLVWLVAIVALVWLLQKGRRRQVLLAACVPLVLCVAVYAKNLAQYGDFTADTCTGLNASHVTTAWLPPAKRDRLIRQGTLSPLARRNLYTLPYTRPDLFRGEPRRNVPILDRPLKRSGYPNLDSAAYLKICDRYLHDAVATVKHDPGSYLRGISASGAIFWRPASQYVILSREDNRNHLVGFDKLYSRFVLGQPVPAGEPRRARASQLGEYAWFVVAAYVATVLLGGAVLIRARRRGELADPVSTVIAFVVLTVVYVAVAGVLLDSGENNRFRSVVDPLVFAATVGLVSERLRTWRSSRLGLR